MSQFSFQQYQEIVEKAKSGSTNNAANSVRVGFFKLKNDGDEALVRFKVSSVDDLSFATTHQLGAAQKYMKINCLAPLGGARADACPLCARAEVDTAIGKAAKKVFVQMLVAYSDPATNGFSAAVPVVWEKPAGFSKEIASLLRNYGDLSKHVFKITRNGVAGDRGTTYAIDYLPIFDKPEFVPEDFSAFNGFDIAKHSYWVKTADEINEFFQTGAFPAVQRKTPTPAAPVAPAQPVAPAAPVYQAPAYTPVANSGMPGSFTAPAAPVTEAAPVAQPAPESTEMPTRKFGSGGFKF